MRWLCPVCNGDNPSCKLCDGGSFITDHEMIKHLECTEISNDRQASLLELDLSEFEEETIL